MNFLFNKYENNIVKYDLINKFKYKKLEKLPNLDFITLHFKLKKWDLKSLMVSLACVKLITGQKAKVTRSRVSNISLKIRKGQPIGCKVTLRKVNMNKFLFKILNTSLSNYKLKKMNNEFSIKIVNGLIFKELEKNYQFFKGLASLNISFKITDCTLKEFLFLLKSYKLII